MAAPLVPASFPSLWLAGCDDLVQELLMGLAGMALCGSLFDQHAQNNHFLKAC